MNLENIEPGTLQVVTGQPAKGKSKLATKRKAKELANGVVVVDDVAVEAEETATVTVIDDMELTEVSVNRDGSLGIGGKIVASHEEPAPAKQEEMFPVVVPEFYDTEMDICDISTPATSKPSASFIRSIEQYGVMEPVILRHDKKNPGKFEIVDGRRRVDACRMIGKETIPARLYQDKDDTGYTYNALTLVANGQRNHNPAIEFLAIMELTTTFGMSESDIAKKTGIPVGTIKKRMRLRQLPDSMREAIGNGKLSIGAAEEAVKLPKVYLDQMARAIESGERITIEDVRDARSVARDDVSNELPDQLFVDELAPSPGELAKKSAHDFVHRYAGIFEDAGLPISDLRDVLTTALDELGLSV